MAGSITSIAVTNLLTHLVGKDLFFKPNALWMGLFTTAPTSVSNGVEVATTIGGAVSGYARQKLDPQYWSMNGSFTITRTADLYFPTALQTWGTVTAIGIFDQSTGGDLYWYAELDPAKLIDTGKALLLDEISLSIASSS